MAFCGKCGQQQEDGVKFCKACGAAIGAQQQQSSQFDINNLNNTKDETASYDQEDINKNKTMAGLAYLLFFLPLIACPESKFAKFHANQGLVLLITGFVLSIAATILRGILNLFTLGFLWWFTRLIPTAAGLITLVLFIVGLMNGLNGKAKELPIIGKIRIIK